MAGFTLPRGRFVPFLVALLSLAWVLAAALSTAGAGTAAGDAAVTGNSVRTVPSVPAGTEHAAAQAGNTVVVLPGTEHAAAQAGQPAAVHCPDHTPPLPACHDQGEFQFSPTVAAPRPDIDTAWGAPRGVPAHDANPASRPGGDAPDLTALSISRT